MFFCDDNGVLVQMMLVAVVTALTEDGNDSDIDKSIDDTVDQHLPSGSQAECRGDVHGAQTRWC